jgi:hypothetical protein
MLTSCPIPGGSEAKAIEESPSIEIEYLSWRIERLIPVPLPSPTSFFPPFSTDSSTSGEDDDPSIDADNAGSSEEHMSRGRIHAIPVATLIASMLMKFQTNRIDT